VENNFLTQLVSEPTRGGISLDLLFTSREALVEMWWSKAVLGLATRKLKTSQFVVK